MSLKPPSVSWHLPLTTTGGARQSRGRGPPSTCSHGNHRNLPYFLVRKGPWHGFMYVFCLSQQIACGGNCWMQRWIKCSKVNAHCKSDKAAAILRCKYGSAAVLTNGTDGNKNGLCQNKCEVRIKICTLLKWKMMLPWHAIAFQNHVTRPCFSVWNLHSTSYLQLQSQVSNKQ